MKQKKQKKKEFIEKLRLTGKDSIRRGDKSNKLFYTVDQTHLADLALEQYSNRIRNTKTFLKITFWPGEEPFTMHIFSAAEHSKGLVNGILIYLNMRRIGDEVEIG